jgi:hypothetical protein
MAVDAHGAAKPQGRSRFAGQTFKMSRHVRQKERPLPDTANLALDPRGESP